MRRDTTVLRQCRGPRWSQPAQCTRGALVGQGGEVDLLCGAALGDLLCGAALGGIYCVRQLWGHLLCGATLGASTVSGNFGGHLLCRATLGGIYCVGQLWRASVWGNFGGIYCIRQLWGASTMWVNSDQLNPMYFKQASLKTRKGREIWPSDPLKFAFIHSSIHSFILAFIHSF